MEINMDILQIPEKNKPVLTMEKPQKTMADLLDYIKPMIGELQDNQ